MKYQDFKATRVISFQYQIDTDKCKGIQKDAEGRKFLLIPAYS